MLFSLNLPYYFMKKGSHLEFFIEKKIARKLKFKLPEVKIKCKLHTSSNWS